MSSLCLTCQKRTSLMDWWAKIGGYTGKPRKSIHLCESCIVNDDYFNNLHVTVKQKRDLHKEIRKINNHRKPLLRKIVVEDK